MKVLLNILLFMALSLGASAQRGVKLMFTGEINFGNNYPNKKNATEPTNLFENAKGIIKKADASFTTLGTVLIDVEGTPNPLYKHSSSPLIRMPESCAAQLKSSGIKTASLASHHIIDFGIEGLTSTSNAMKAHGINFAGIKSLHEYCIFEDDGVKYGFATFGTSVHTPLMKDSANVRKIISHLNAQSDIVVIAFSNNEFQLKHKYSSNKNEHHAYINSAAAFAHLCIDAGADIVYGNGEEQIMPLELYRDRLIIYGLGNFCTPFKKSANTEQERSPVIEAELLSDGTFNKGKIHSFKQMNAAGPRQDSEREALKTIIKQTGHYFPDTNLEIEESGNFKSTSKSMHMLTLQLVAEAYKHKGKRYRGGAMGPMVFDCSGFTSYVFLQMGIKLKRSSREQYTMGTEVGRSDLQPGDLVFFKGSATSRTIGHVGMVVSVDKQNNTFKFAHASPSRGIVVDDFGKMAYYIKRYVGARRILTE